MMYMCMSCVCWHVLCFCRVWLYSVLASTTNFSSRLSGEKKKKTNPVYLCLFCISLSFDIVSKFINFKSATILCFWVLYLIKFQPNLDSLNPEIETQITKD